LRSQDGEEAIMGSTHEIGEEAGVGGDGHQICIVEVTCVVLATGGPAQGRPFWRKEVF
jgi:hypothetical protein